MKDFLLISMVPKEETPYAEFYTKALDKNACTWDIIYFERYGLHYCPKENEIVFDVICPTGGSRLSKVWRILKYCAFIRRRIRNNSYKSLIVLTTVPGVFICDYLLGKYKNCFILDIRDYSYESNPIYYSLIKRIINASFVTVLSSRGFLRFLPKTETNYVFCHNIPSDYKVKEKQSIFKESVTRIGFVGSVRYYDVNTKLIDAFKNDSEFHLEYYGTVTTNCDLEGYCRQGRIRNVEFHGRYLNNQKKDIYKKIDLINAIYGAKSYETTTALPNRLYDAAIYLCPIIATKGTYLAELVAKYALGFSVDIDNEDVLARTKNYIATFNEAIFREGCRNLLKQVDRDFIAYKKKVTEFVKFVQATR